MPEAGTGASAVGLTVSAIGHIIVSATGQVTLGLSSLAVQYVPLTQGSAVTSFFCAWANATLSAPQVTTTLSVSQATVGLSAPLVTTTLSVSDGSPTIT